MKKFVNNNNLLWNYIEIASSQIYGAVNKGSKINIRCNVCGDSDKDKTKKRGYIIWDHKRDIVYYKCFNEGDCAAAGEGNSWSGSRWLKQFYPTMYKKYLYELLGNNENLSLSDKKSELKKINENHKIDNEELGAVKHFRPIMSTSNEIFKTAREQCKLRGIPRSTYKDFFVSIDGKYNKRLIIPFYDSNGRIYYYQARALYDWQSPKYLNRTLGRDSAIYGYYTADTSKCVTVLEGPIDSMFVQNSIAVLGLTWTDEVKKKLEKFDKLRYMLDNDDAGKKKSIKLIKEKKFVFNWRKFINDYNLPQSIKDVNDTYRYLNRKSLFTIEELDKYFTNDYYDQIYFM